MTRKDLEALIDSGEFEACITAFQGMPEAERLKLGATAVARLRALGRIIPPRLAPLMDAETVGQVLPLLSMVVPQAARWRAARAAALATASLSQWKTVKRHGLPSNDAVFRILSDRSPPWLGELVELICDEEDHLTNRWTMIRRLVREGYCSPPRTGRYIDRMLQTLPGEAWSAKGGLKELLQNDAGLLEHEIWRIFATEPGPGAILLFTADMEGVRPETTWEVALTELAAEGTIPRVRLLDAALDGLSRDLHEQRARWFVALHDRLDPSLEERATRAARYLDLLGSRNPSAVPFALKVLKDLLKGGRVDPKSLVDRLAPALHARTKGTVKQAIALFELAVRNDDRELTRCAVMVAAEGLIHESADIQAAVLDFAVQHGDPHDHAIRELFAARLDSIAVSLRGRLETWLAVCNVPMPEPANEDLDLSELATRTAALEPRLAAIAGVPEALAAVGERRSDLPALRFDGTEIPRLDPSRRLEPIDDLDTLIDLCSHLVENPTRADDIDRCVDAISRLCDVRPGDFEKRTAPLAARLKQRLDAPPDVNAGILRNFGVVLLGWLFRTVPDRVDFNSLRPLDSFMSAWVFAVARRVVRGRSAPLLAAPTHAGGWIDPRAFVDRFRRHCRLPVADVPEDLTLALLRLAPDHRRTALADGATSRASRGLRSVTPWAARSIRSGSRPPSGSPLRGPGRHGPTTKQSRLDTPHSARTPVEPQPITSTRLRCGRTPPAP